MRADYSVLLNIMKLLFIITLLKKGHWFWYCLGQTSHDCTLLYKRMVNGELCKPKVKATSHCQWCWNLIMKTYIHTSFSLNGLRSTALFNKEKWRVVSKMDKDPNFAISVKMKLGWIDYHSMYHYPAPKCIWDSICLKHFFTPDSNRKIPFYFCWSQITTNNGKGQAWAN